jgi:DNA transformation protein and related proteins
MLPKKDDSFKDFIIDQLSGLEGVTGRAMFGGHGLYRGGTFFGIIFKGRLYFKTNNSTRDDYFERGMKAFRPNPGQTLKNYFEVPADILEEPELLAAWAQDAIRCCRQDNP